MKTTGQSANPPEPGGLKRRASPDGGLRQLFFKHLKADAAWTPIETFIIAAGVPDAHYIFKGGFTGWCEFKQTAGWKPVIVPLQIAWLARYTRLGGRAWVCLRRDMKGEDELWMVRGRTVEVLAMLGLKGVAERDKVWCGDGGPISWDWCVVRRLLTEKL